MVQRHGHVSVRPTECRNPGGRRKASTVKPQIMNSKSSKEKKNLLDYEQ